MARPSLGPRARSVIYSTRLTAQEAARVEAVAQGMRNSEITREALMYWLSAHEVATKKTRRPIETVEPKWEPEAAVTHHTGQSEAPIVNIGEGHRHKGDVVSERYEKGVKITTLRCECGRVWER